MNNFQNIGFNQDATTGTAKSFRKYERFTGNDIDIDDILNYTLYIEGTNSFFADTINVPDTEDLIYYSVPVQKLMEISSPEDIVSSQDNFKLKLEWYVACYDSMSTIYSNHRDIEITISNFFLLGFLYSLIPGSKRVGLTPQ